MSADPNPLRANSLATLDDLDDVQPGTFSQPKQAAEVIRQISEASNHSSRAATPKGDAALASITPARAPQRRHRTGRNVQVNLKVTAATSERFARISNEQGWVFGQTLDHALDALEVSLDKERR